MRLVALTGGRYHAASISSTGVAGNPRARATPALYVSLRCRSTNVTLNENDIGAYRTFLKLSPPLRAEDDRVAWSRPSPTA